MKIKHKLYERHIVGKKYILRHLHCRSIFQFQHDHSTDWVKVTDNSKGLEEYWDKYHSGDPTSIYKFYPTVEIGRTEQDKEVIYLGMVK